VKKRIRILSVRMTTDDEKTLKALTRALGAASPSELVRRLMSERLEALKSEAA
jgi:hypothetical protein